MAYQVDNFPPDAPAWMVREFRKLQEALQAPIEGMTFKTLYAEPKKKPEGLTVKADGTTWNPGSGAGVYCYRGGAWRLLG